MELGEVLSNLKFIQQYVTLDELKELLKDVAEDLDSLFQAYQVNGTEFMDLKLLMAEKGINTKEFDLNDDLEVEIKQLKKRQENTALNIY